MRASAASNLFRSWQEPRVTPGFGYLVRSYWPVYPICSGVAAQCRAVKYASACSHHGAIGQPCSRCCLGILDQLPMGAASLFLSSRPVVHEQRFGGV